MPGTLRSRKHVGGVPVFGLSSPSSSSSSSSSSLSLSLSSSFFADKSSRTTRQGHDLSSDGGKGKGHSIRRRWVKLFLSLAIVCAIGSGGAYLVARRRQGRQRAASDSAATLDSEAAEAAEVASGAGPAAGPASGARHAIDDSASASDGRNAADSDRLGEERKRRAAGGGGGGGGGGSGRNDDGEDRGSDTDSPPRRNADAAAKMMDLPLDDPTLLSDHLGARLHVVFSTDCSPFQHWQSYLLFYSALRVGQPGRVTRIASGCTDEDAAAAVRWHDRHVRDGMSARFGLHLTPRFSGVTDKDGKTVGDYKFFNKPFGLKHWLENGDGAGIDPSTGSLRDEDAVVVLIDPDMVLLRPITSDFTDTRGTLVGREGLRVGRVAHGSPFGQTYGLGTQWRHFDLVAIAGETSPALNVTKEDGRDFYPVGPPYLATARDMLAIATRWAEFAPRVHSQYPHLLAEMFAYCIAAAHLRLPHQKINSLMVSNSGTGGEGWPLVDRIPSDSVCGFMTDGPDHEEHALPYVMHLCQRYIVGPWFFAKRKLPRDFFTCDHPLLEVPPPDLAVKFDYKVKPSEHIRVDITKEVAHQDAFMMCGAIGYLNEAGTYFKSKGCERNEVNYEKTLNLAELFNKKI